MYGRSQFIDRFQAGSSPPGLGNVYQDLLWIRSDLYNFVSILNYNTPIYDLYKKAKGGDTKSACRLVQIDKTAVYSDWYKEFIVNKQYEADWDYFKTLGQWISKPPLNKQQYLFRLIVITAKYWHEHLANLSYSELVKLYIDLKILPPSTNVENFRKTLNRVGIKKRRYNKKQDI